MREALAQAEGGLDGDLDAAAARDGVEDDRLGGGLGDDREVAEEAFLLGLL
jgi:hypothetical protein